MKIYSEFKHASQELCIILANLAVFLLDVLFTVFHHKSIRRNFF